MLCHARIAFFLLLMDFFVIAHNFFFFFTHMHIKWLHITIYLKQQILTTYLVIQQDHAQGENPPNEILNYCPQVRVSEVHLHLPDTRVNV